MIPKGWAYDTQIMEWVLSYDGVRSTDALAITAASAVAAISDVPLKKPIAGVRVGWAPGGSEPLINPTVEQMRDSRLDLVLAGTEDAVMMIEGFGDFLTVDEMLYAIEKGHEAVAKACKDIKAWAEEVGREKKTDKMLVAPEGVDAAVAEAVGPDLATAMAIGPKQMRGAAVEKVRNVAMDALKDQFQVRRATRREGAGARHPETIPSRRKRAHSPKGPRRVHSWGRGRAAQLPRAQNETHGRFDRTLGPPWGRTRVLPTSSLCTRLKRFLRGFFFFRIPRFFFRDVFPSAALVPHERAQRVCCSLSLSHFFFCLDVNHHESYTREPRSSDVRLACGRIEPRAVAT